ncbi:hypothetical protein PO002_11080 [Cupriavidus necator]|uniref:hypothetical protein n=1 Tax=Cupriavidus necator TaxID=106590 RepID=UPI0039C4DF21
MDQRVPVCSIEDIAYSWGNGFADSKKFALLHAFFSGELKVIDPLVDVSILDTPKEEEEFVRRNSTYGHHYLSSGEQVLMNSRHHAAISEYLQYGRPITVDNAHLSGAMSHLCIRKYDFREWLEKTSQPLPEFWFSAEERGIIALPKDSRQADVSAHSIGDTERASLQKQIAALALVIAEKSTKYKNGDKPNANQIAEAVSSTLDAMPDVNKRGVSSASLRASISAGIELLQGKRGTTE